MKRVLKALARLYPRVWRERYGEEFDALLEDRTARIFDISDVLWGALKMRVTARNLARTVIPCGLAGSLVASGIAAFTPTRYNSNIVVTVTSRRISPACSNPGDLPAALRGGRTDVCGEGAPAVDRLMLDWIRPDSDPKFLSSVIQQKNLYRKEQQAHVPIERLVDTMRANTRLLPVGTAETASSTRAYRIQFQYSDPQVAREVVAILIHHAAESYVRSTTALRKSEGVLAPQQFARVISFVNPATLPKRPAGLRPVEQVGIGLAVGTLAGLLLALGIGPQNGSRSGDSFGKGKVSRTI